MMTVHTFTIPKLASALLTRSAWPVEEVGAALRDALRDVAEVWSYQLTTIDGRALTVGKVVIALLVVAVGTPAD
jgi:hypothetical protein